MVVGDFKNSAFIASSEWLKKPGDTLVFGNNYDNPDQETHAVAVTLVSDIPRRYALIDAIGTAPVSLGRSTLCS